MWGIKLFSRKKPNDSEVVESFQNSFESDNAIDMAIDVTDLTIDKFIDSDAVNGIPVVRLLNATYKVYKNVQAYRLAKKVYLFLYHTKDIGADKKREFISEYVESNNEEGIDALLSVIDLLDNQNKVKIMANLLNSKVEGSITIYEFNRLVTCLQRVPYSDIVKLKDYNKEYYEPGVAEVLYAAGILFISTEDFENSTNRYRLNYNGMLLLKYGLGADVEMPVEYKVNRPSFIPPEDIDVLFDPKLKL